MLDACESGQLFWRKSRVKFVAREFGKQLEDIELFVSDIFDFVDCRPRTFVDFFDDFVAISDYHSRAAPAFLPAKCGADWNFEKILLTRKQVACQFRKISHFCKEIIVAPCIKSILVLAGDGYGLASRKKGYFEGK